MKLKLAFIAATILTIFTSVTVNANACIWFVNQPKTPKALR